MMTLNGDGDYDAITLGAKLSADDSIDFVASPERRLADEPGWSHRNTS